MPPVEVDTLRQKLENLGQQISAAVQHYNDLKRELMADPNQGHPTLEQIKQLLEQRRAAIQAILDQHKSRIDQLRVSIGQPPASLPQMQGLGRLGQTAELDQMSSQLTDQQSKLQALGLYYEAYKAALANNQAPPPLPSALNTGSRHYLTGAVLAAAYFLMKK